MEIRIEVSDRGGTDRFAALVLQHRLHYRTDSTIRMWCKHWVEAHMRPKQKGNRKSLIWVQGGVKHQRPYRILALAYEVNEPITPIGCFVVHGSYTGFYVKPDYRRRGVARSLLAAAAAKYDLSGYLINMGISLGAKALRRRFQTYGAAKG